MRIIVLEKFCAVIVLKDAGVGETAVEQAIADDGITSLYKLIAKSTKCVQKNELEIKRKFLRAIHVARHNDYEDLEYSTIVNYLLYL